MPNRWVQHDPSEEHPLLLEGGWPGPAAPSEHRRPVTKSEVDWQACTTQPPPAHPPTTHAFIAFIAGAAAAILFAFMAFITGAAAATLFAFMAFIGGATAATLLAFMAFIAGAAAATLFAFMAFMAGAAPC